MQLIEDYPDYRFTCSQAQQYAWLLEDQPALFKRIQEKAKDQKFLPIGGTWVEMDCNIPSGEAFCRQFLYGRRFFKQHFGEQGNSKVFWLPDTFGIVVFYTRLFFPTPSNRERKWNGILFHSETQLE